MILALEGLGADGADVLALVTVRELMLGQSARVVEDLPANLTVHIAALPGATGLGRAALTPGLGLCLQRPLQGQLALSLRSGPGRGSAAAAPW